MRDEGFKDPSPYLSDHNLGRVLRRRLLEMYHAPEDFLTMWFQQPDADFHQRPRAINLYFVVLDASFPLIEYSESLEGVRRLCATTGLSGEMPPLTEPTRAGG